MNYEKEDWEKCTDLDRRNSIRTQCYNHSCSKGTVVKSVLHEDRMFVLTGLSVLHDVIRHSRFIIWHEDKPLNCVISSQTRTYRGKITHIHLLFRSCNLLPTVWSLMSKHTYAIFYKLLKWGHSSLSSSLFHLFSVNCPEMGSPTHTHTNK